MQNAFSAQRAKCTPGIDIWSLKETVKMRQEKGGRTRRANLDLKSWNKMLRSGGRRGSGLEIFTFNGFRGGQVDKAPLRVRLLRGRDLFTVTP